MIDYNYFTGFLNKGLIVEKFCNEFRA